MLLETIEAPPCTEFIPQKADYVAIAKAAFARRFSLTPVRPGEKRAFLYGWNRNPTTTVSEVLQHAKDFPNCNVGIVGKRQVGHVCFVDIDAPGVLELIERETGQGMPETYTVCSRPHTAPYNGTTISSTLSTQLPKSRRIAVERILPLTSRARM